jgi:hypothetical protein
LGSDKQSWRSGCALSGCRWGRCTGSLILGGCAAADPGRTSTAYGRPQSGCWATLMKRACAKADAISTVRTKRPGLNRFHCVGSFENTGVGLSCHSCAFNCYEYFFFLFFSRCVRLGPELARFKQMKDSGPASGTIERCHWRIMGPSAGLSG